MGLGPKPSKAILITATIATLLSISGIIYTMYVESYYILLVFILTFTVSLVCGDLFWSNHAHYEATEKGEQE
jgi:hypothetical protein